jgi:hypothetical protein
MQACGGPWDFANLQKGKGQCGDCNSPTDAVVKYRNKSGKLLHTYVVERKAGTVLLCDDLEYKTALAPSSELRVSVSAGNVAWIRFQESKESAGCDSRFNKFESKVFANKCQCTPEEVDIF